MTCLIVFVVFWKSSKVNKFGTLLKVKCLILLNIFSVFPTHVGMFPPLSGRKADHRCLPHACGDVPDCGSVMWFNQSSPRMWGCSGGCQVRFEPRVFPTHVGILLFSEFHGAVFVRVFFLLYKGGVPSNKGLYGTTQKLSSPR